MKLRLVFCGTPAFAVPTLERLAEAGHEVLLVVTQPDRPRGRGLEMAHSPVKVAALALHLPIEQPKKIRDSEGLRGLLEALAPDAIIVVGYGRLIPRWMLDLPRLGNINLHASLLPRYRGAAPIQWAIANGESETGNTTMRLNEGLDTGDILLQEKAAISPDDTALTLSARLAVSGAELMLRTVEGLAEGSIRPVPQDHAQATLAPILRRDDGHMDFTRTAQRLYDRLRGFQPWPGAYALFRDRHLTVHSARPRKEISAPLGPGELLAGGDRVLAGCADGSALELLELQMEGRKRLSGSEFARGQRLEPGERLE